MTEVSIHDVLDSYNKLIKINNITKFPWDLKEKIDNDKFIPTYKNITLYYKDIQLEEAPKNKLKKGGVSVYLI